MSSDQLKYFSPDLYKSSKDIKPHYVVLFYTKDCEELAKSIALKSKGDIQLGIVTIDKFPDTFPNIFIQNAELLRFVHCVFLCTMHLPSVIFEEFSIMMMLPRYGVRSLKIILPYFATGTMERINRNGEIPTAYTLSVLLSQTPQTQQGPPQLITLDIHTLQNQFYFTNNINVVLASAIPLLHRALRVNDDTYGNNESSYGSVSPQMQEKSDMVVVFPDYGAHRRFGSMFENYSHIICSKKRDGNVRKVTIVDGDVDCKGRNVIIVDDLVHSGGTILETIKALKEHGANEVNAYATHGVFEQDAWLKFVEAHENGVLQKFFICNTHPQAIKLKGIKPFHLLCISDVIVPYICRERRYQSFSHDVINAHDLDMSGVFSP